MLVLTLDFETYYDSEHTIDKVSMGQYLFDKKAQVMLMSYKEGDVPTRMATGESEIKAVLASYDWSQIVLVAHNINFDARVILDKFGHKPAKYIDTMALMAATGGNVIVNGNSLSHVAKLLQKVGIAVADKGTERAAAKGKRLFRFPDGRWYMHECEINNKYLHSIQLSNYTKKGVLAKGKKDARTIVADAIQFYHDYVAYAINDTDICYAAFRYLLPLLPAMELKYHQIMIRCYTDPVLKLNADVLLKEMKRLQKRRLDKVRPIADTYYGGNIEEAKKALSSKALFAVLLKSMGGVEDYEVFDAQARDEQIDYAFLIPTKVSEKTGKHDYAFALTDTAFVELANVSPELKTVLDARKEVASSLEFSRTERFLSSCKWEKTFGLPYKISGAATHRASGAMSLNVQNLSSGRKEGQTTALRDSMCAPAGFKIMAVDSSQVEARILAFVSGCVRQLEVFSSGADFYSSIGEAIYNEPAAHINAMRKAGDAEYIYKRSVAKSCGLGLGYGMGAEAFVDAAFVLAGVVIDLVRSKELKQIYETNYPEIKQFWNTCNKVIGHMLVGGSGTFGGPDGKLFYYDGNYQIHGATVPSIIMPSGMRLSYYKLCRRKKSYADGSERDNYAYWGLKEGRYQWVYLWGSKLTENLCIAEDTLVLTDFGWKAIQRVTTYDKVFDGVDFVTHGGLVFKSTKPCVSIDGVFMTKDHEVLTNGNKWETAESLLVSRRDHTCLQRLDRNAVRDVGGFREAPRGRSQVALGVPMRLWEYCGETGHEGEAGSSQGWNTKLRMRNKAPHKQEENLTWKDQSSTVLDMEEHEGTVPKSEPQSLQELRWARYTSMRPMVGVSKLLERRLSFLLLWDGLGQNKQQRRVLPRECPVGQPRSELQQQTHQRTSHASRERVDNQGIERDVQHRCIHTAVQIEPWRYWGATSTETRRDAKVYDIMNCGQRNRFVVLGARGPMIVHNCQALAFDVMKYQGVKMAEQLKIVLNTHDEWGVVVKEDDVPAARQFAEKCMREVPSWLEGLVVDCESAVGDSYGEC